MRRRWRVLVNKIYICAAMGRRDETGEGEKSRIVVVGLVVALWAGWLAGGRSLARGE